MASLKSTANLQQRMETNYLRVSRIVALADLYYFVRPAQGMRCAYIET